MAEPPPTAIRPSQRCLAVHRGGRAHRGLGRVGRRLVEHRDRQVAERVERLLQHAGGAHAGIGDDQRPRDADALAFAAQQLDGAEVELDLGEVLDEGHGACRTVRCGPSNLTSADALARIDPSSSLTCPQSDPQDGRRGRPHGARRPAAAPRADARTRRKAAYEKGAGVLEVPQAAAARASRTSACPRATATRCRRGCMRLRTSVLPRAAVLPRRRLHRRQHRDTHDTLCRVLSAAQRLRGGLARLPAGARAQVPDRVERCLGRAAVRCAQSAARCGLDGAASRSAATAPAARWPRCARSSRAMPACRWRCSCCSTRARRPHQDTRSHRLFADGLAARASRYISWFFGQYIDARAERDDWRFAPLNADDVEGVAPAWIGLAECDPVVDEGIAYADKLRAAACRSSWRSTAA